MLRGQDGRNINGPSMIKVPDWVENKLGNYYLYFAHHKGTFIRLAYADRVEGPWRIHAGGSLHLENCPAVRDHIASPDVLVDEANRRIVMYFHGPSSRKTGQYSFMATSADGVDFEPVDAILGPPYAKVFSHQGRTYGLFSTSDISMYRSADGFPPFERGSLAFDKDAPLQPRHLAVLKLSETRLAVFYTRRGDKPERIMVGYVDLARDWLDWQVRGARSVLRPRKRYEGGHLPLTRSRRGIARRPERALRDPALFRDGDRTYLLYAVAGEQGIAISELLFGWRALNPIVWLRDRLRRRGG